jgi:FAD/FMN-containing dehydrogenase
MSPANAIARHSLETLRSAIAGEVFVPGDDGYDEARRGRNLSVDQRPSAVVSAESVADVVRAVRFARSHEMRIAPQSTGHGSAPLEPLEGAMLLKTSQMRRVEIYPATQTARIESGADWQDVTVPAGEHGLAALAGTSPNVGVAGYTLGGGIGWLARRYGLASNSVTAVDVVTPDGRLARADAEHEPDLLWAVRGGGGSLGVVSAFEMTVYPVRELFAGALLFPIDRASEVLHAWRTWTDTVPEKLTSLGRILRLPSLPEVPQLMRGRGFVLVEAAYLGDAVGGAELIGPLRRLGPELDTFAMMPAPALSQLHMDPEQPVPAAGDGALLADFPAEAIEALVALTGPDAGTPLQSIEIRHLGGALGRDAPDGGAQARVDGEYAMFAVGITQTRELGDAVRAHSAAVTEALTDWHASYNYYNLAENRSGADAVLPPDAYQRLREIKATYDPDEAIISTHPVRPAGA